MWAQKNKYPFFSVINCLDIFSSNKLSKLLFFLKIQGAIKNNIHMFIQCFIYVTPAANLEPTINLTRTWEEARGLGRTGRTCKLKINAPLDQRILNP